eukprot:TRINITY_DN7861_c0_g2_i1.p1 TRINITY_DN7861_c0_g2~~TRINITY_DN7861_c0_g2_i1.p1  ORF type:complete len:265 (+),score=37.84 TRINITY_DN7861_c0_g2_i1:110-904(+)
MNDHDSGSNRFSGTGTGSRVKGFLKRKQDIPESVIKNVIDAPPSAEGDTSANANAQSEAFDAEKSRKMLRKALAEEPRDHFRSQAGQRSFWEGMTLRFRNMANYYMTYKKRSIRRFTMEFLPLIGFISFSCYILWKMEDQYDRMRRKVLSTKSFKEIEIERENELIRRQLQENRFEENVPIQEITDNVKYKFEFDDDDDDDENTVTLMDGRIDDDFPDYDEKEMKFLQDSIKEIPKKRGGPARPPSFPQGQPQRPQNHGRSTIS